MLSHFNFCFKIKNRPISLVFKPVQTEANSKQSLKSKKFKFKTAIPNIFN